MAIGLMLTLKRWVG